MAVQVFKYSHTTELFTAHGLNWLTDTFNLHLLESSYTFDAGHTQFSQLSADEVDDVSYDEVEVTGKDSDAEKLTASPAVFPSLDATFRYGVMVADGVFDGKTNPPLFLILFDDSPADVSVPGVDYTVPWNINGVFALNGG